MPRRVFAVSIYACVGARSICGGRLAHAASISNERIAPHERSMIMMVAPLSGEVGVCLLWLPDGARRWSAVRVLDESRSCAQVALQHTLIDIGTARAPCFPVAAIRHAAPARTCSIRSTHSGGARRKTREALRHRNPAGQRQPTG